MNTRSPQRFLRLIMRVSPASIEPSEPPCAPLPRAPCRCAPDAVGRAPSGAAAEPLSSVPKPSVPSNVSCRASRRRARTRSQELTRGGVLPAPRRAAVDGRAGAASATECAMLLLLLPTVAAVGAAVVGPAPPSPSPRGASGSNAEPDTPPNDSALPATGVLPAVRASALESRCATPSRCAARMSANSDASSDARQESAGTGFDTPSVSRT
mmetsp:Transcript_22677/g.58345  ORF Transcript_22677/g.58345 Transcript_22677/m.58345 type:complete len:211 (+) Transcript_22677:123-755(+)